MQRRIKAKTALYVCVAAWRKRDKQREDKTRQDTGAGSMDATRYTVHLAHMEYMWHQECAAETHRTRQHKPVASISLVDEIQAIFLSNPNSTHCDRSNMHHSTAEHSRIKLRGLTINGTWRRHWDCTKFVPGSENS